MSDCTKATELLYQGTSVRGMDFGHPLVVPYYSTTAFKVQTLAEVREMLITEHRTVFPSPDSAPTVISSMHINSCP